MEWFGIELIGWSTWLLEVELNWSRTFNDCQVTGRKGKRNGNEKENK